MFCSFFIDSIFAHRKKNNKILMENRRKILYTVNMVSEKEANKMGSNKNCETARKPMSNTIATHKL